MCRDARCTFLFFYAITRDFPPQSISVAGADNKDSLSGASRRVIRRWRRNFSIKKPQPSLDTSSNYATFVALFNPQQETPGFAAALKKDSQTHKYELDNISACRTMRMWLHFLPWQCKGSRRNAAVLMVCRVRPSLHS